MFFSRKPKIIPKISAPPPWENIDAVPKKIVSTAFSLVMFTVRVTGFSLMGARILLLAFSAAFLFVAYALYINMQQPFPTPPHAERAAIDSAATTSLQ